ncbi:RNA polymerase sigma factor [Zhongshania aliphaticivorans]|uniref:RNA polymerase sigma factor n=1 Tax=Zhongshania aliphaticivorans TaxID=1470434 RepID=UPI0012E49C13|nr:sigma-70 family RNA polymerase sigma factor [Zhongshania aliphaticivorans]CAA0119529.1 putative RNA polymerase sigma factor FecI [Zhongshania aliphaticivorans]
MPSPTFTSLTQAVEAYYEELRQFVRKRTGSSSMAEDVVQETWIRANSASVPMPDNPRAYLYRMAGNLAVDQLRRQQSQLPKPVESGDADDTENTLFELPCLAPSPEEIAASQREFAVLHEAVRELPDKCREVFLLYRGHGLTMREIAKRLAISDKTVEKHIARAMVHCRQRLRDAGRDV